MSVAEPFPCHPVHLETTPQGGSRTEAGGPGEDERGAAPSPSLDGERGLCREVLLEPKLEMGFSSERSVLIYGTPTSAA